MDWQTYEMIVGKGNIILRNQVKLQIGYNINKYE